MTVPYLAGDNHTRETRCSCESDPFPATVPQGFTPARVLEIEIGGPLPAVSSFDSRTGRRYRRALALVRLHGEPLGLIHLDLGERDLSPEEAARLIWRALGDEIVAHLRRDGLPAAGGLDQAGLSRAGGASCLERRARFLAGAPFASVVVATRDRPDSLERCLHSLLSLDYPRYEIIVVDNAPASPATARLVSRFRAAHPHVRYFREDRAGCSWARTRGLSEARGEIVAFTDDDVVLDRQWLANLVWAFEEDEEIGGVTGLILPQELETPAQQWIEQYGGFAKGFRRRVFDLKENRAESPLYPFCAGIFGSGANMAFRTSVLRRLGGFDPALGSGTPAMGGEDLAAYFQVIVAGYKLVYQPAAIVYHRHHRSVEALRRQIYSYGVGLTAFLTRCLVDHPKLLFQFLGKVPYGLFFIFSPHSPKNRKKRADYPKELTALELRGMLYGPLAFVKGRWRARRSEASSGTSHRAAEDVGPARGRREATRLSVRQRRPGRRQGSAR